MDWQLESDRLILTLAPGSEALSGYGVSELCLHTDEGEYFVAFPVRFTTAGPAADALTLTPDSDLKIETTDGSASIAVEGEVVTLTSPPVPDFHNARFEGVYFGVPGTDISGYDRVSFEVMVTQPSLDMQMRVALKAVEGTVYNSWIQPDVLTGAGDWQTVTIPLDSFGLTRLSEDFQCSPLAPLDAVRWLIVSVNGNNPEAGVTLRLRNVRLETR